MVWLGAGAAVLFVPAIVHCGTCSCWRVTKTLRFWVDVAYDEIKSDHDNVTKQQLLAQILRRYEERGDAMRCLDKQGKITWKASPRFLTKLADAEREAQDELEDFL
jgi:hypothetical protein